MCDKHLNSNNIKKKVNVYCECCGGWANRVPEGKEIHEYICDDCWRQLNGIKYPEGICT